MLMGKVCTRACQFCAVDTGNPRGWLDPDEVANSARTVELMGLRYVVLTSVDRDDLRRRRRAPLRRLHPRDQGALSADGRRGADAGLRRQSSPTSRRSSTRASTCSRRTSRPSSGSRARCATRAPATGKRSTCSRSPSAIAPDVLTKSSLMLGLGETEDEIAAALDDLKQRRRRHRDVRPVLCGRRRITWPSSVTYAARSSSVYRAVGARARLPRSRRGTARALELPRRPRVREEQRGALSASERVPRRIRLVSRAARDLRRCWSSLSSCSSWRRAAAATPRASSSST